MMERKCEIIELKDRQIEYLEKQAGEYYKKMRELREENWQRIYELGEEHCQQMHELRNEYGEEIEGYSRSMHRLKDKHRQEMEKIAAQRDEALQRQNQFAELLREAGRGEDRVRFWELSVEEVRELNPAMRQVVQRLREISRELDQVRFEWDQALQGTNVALAEAAHMMNEMNRWILMYNQKCHELQKVREELDQVREILEQVKASRREAMQHALYDVFRRATNPRARDVPPEVVRKAAGF